jgi:phosphoenolpyruvate-protein kinase (PTS system EI component)
MPSQSPSEAADAQRGSPTELSVTTRRAVSLRGQTASPGTVLAPLHLMDFELESLGGRRIQRDRVERELLRFRAALTGAEQQLQGLRQSVSSRLSEADLRILDTHLALLQDGVFIADVERLILEKHFALEAAIVKVVEDFDRIFKLVQSERLRQSAVDLRDVGMRVLRNLAPEQGEGRGESPQDGRYVLVARELSIVDMFNLDNQHVAGIATEEGSLAAHAAVFARSLGIPTLVGVKGLLEKASEGLPALLDASEGFICFDPDDRLKAQFQRQPRAAEQLHSSVGKLATKDGVEIELSAVCGSLPEVELAARAHAARIAVYRTELLFLIDEARPSREALVLHYRAVLEAAAGAPVTFRLLSLDPNVEGQRGAVAAGERNPQLGIRGLRHLLAEPAVLELQLEALLLAAVGFAARIAIPFVVDLGDFRALRDALVAARQTLKKQGQKPAEDIPLGAILETPASLYGLDDLAREADFAVLALGSLSELMLAADRTLPQLAPRHERLHPFVLRAVEQALRVAGERRLELTLVGSALERSKDLTLALGLGARRVGLPPVAFAAAAAEIAGLRLDQAEPQARAALRAGRIEELDFRAENLREGYGRRD